MFQQPYKVIGLYRERELLAPYILPSFIWQRNHTLAKDEKGLAKDQLVEKVETELRSSSMFFQERTKTPHCTVEDFLFFPEER